jgi:hypothetical protein
MFSNPWILASPIRGRSMNDQQAPEYALHEVGVTADEVA